MLGVLPGRDRLDPGERGAEARARDRRPARRPPAPLRRARRVVHRGLAPPRPGLPRLRRARRRSPSTSTTSSSAQGTEGARMTRSASPRRCAPRPAASARCPARGETVRELLDDLTARFPGARGPAPVRERLRRRRGHPHARRARDAGPRGRDGDPPAGDGRRWLAGSPPALLDLVGDTPLVELHAPGAEAGRPALREARGREPDRLDQGPRREGDDRGRRGVRRARAGPRAARADERQHGDLARDGREAEGLPAHLRDARERDRGAPAAAADLRRRDRRLPGRGGLERRRPPRARARRARPAAASCRSSTRTRRTRAPTTRAPAPRSPRRSTASTSSSPASAPAAR